MTNAPSNPLNLYCPSCSEPLEVDGQAVGRLARCPYCSAQFIASADTAALDIVDDTAVAAEHLENAAPQLDGHKIRQLASLRRGAIRARSWCWIAAVVAAVGAAQLLVKAWENIRHLHAVTARAVGFSLFASVGIAFAISMLRTGRRLTREINAPGESDPNVKPDFSTLSDGTQRWTNLHDVR